MNITSIAIRVDANNSMGIGHVMRCLAVAEQLKIRNCKVVFLSKEIPESLKKRICSKGFAFQHIPISHCNISNTMQCIRDRSVRYLIVDGYHINEQYILEAKKMGVFTIRFDDIRQDINCSAHIIINASATANYEQYRKLTSNTKLLLGSKFFAFREEMMNNFALVEKRTHENSNSILINFGGSDHLDLSYPVAIALSKAFPDTSVNVVTGAAYNNPDRFNNLSQKNIKHFHDISFISQLMAGAQLAISAGGGTIAELELYKVPTILVITADNQIEATNKTWCHVIHSSIKSQILIDSIIHSALELWSDKSIRDQMLSKLNTQLDCFGAVRIAEEILKLRTTTDDK